MISHSTHTELSSSGASIGQAKNDVWKNYKAYLATTSIVLPVPPRLYRPLPEWMKRTILLDFPMFKFDEEKDGKAALDEARRQEA